MQTEWREFEHHQAAHCESGVTSNLLRHAGLPVSEAMAFGIGSGLFFIYVPLIKVMGLPLTSYRSFPGSIFKKTCKRLKIPYEYKKFRSPEKGERQLDSYLEEHRAVGMQSNIYWLPYIPEQFRFQFNAHNLVVFAKAESDDYLVSDPILEHVSICPARALQKARFAKGILAPKGLMYFPRPTNLDHALPLSQAVHKGIKETVQRMLYAPFIQVGVRGIRYLSRQIENWPKTLPRVERQKLYLANVVRMQEEIGTGGAGFRFLYAAFLQEAGDQLGNQALLDASKQMTEVGNSWREFATISARFCKDRAPDALREIPQLLLQIAEQEKSIYQGLRRNYL